MKLGELKEKFKIFWDMNEVSFTKEVEKEEKVILHLTWTEYKTIEHVKLHKTGDILFFDWADKHDGSADHVGIVEKVENGRVYTIEGNSHDVCKQKDYDINSTEIRGYGTPVY